MAGDDGETRSDAEPAAGGPPPSGLVPAPRGRPWGFWASLGWTALWIGLWMLVGTVVAVAAATIAVVRDPKLDAQAFVAGMAGNGLLIALAAILAAPVQIGLVVLLAWVRMPVRVYLGLGAVGARETLVGVGLLGVLLAAQDGLTLLAGRPVVPPFMVEAYRTAGFLPLLVAALVVAAPMAEETLFRGFLFAGIAASRAGAVGAVLISSAVWAAIHLQYDLYGVGLIFVEGLFLGIVRWKTGSVTLTILLHAVANAIATIEATVVVEGWL